MKRHIGFLSVLLVVELPMFSLKITDFSWKSNRVRYLYFGTAILLAILFQIGFLTFLIPLYILFSLVGYWAGWTTKLRVDRILQNRNRVK